MEVLITKNSKQFTSDPIVKVKGSDYIRAGVRRKMFIHLINTARNHLKLKVYY